MISEEKINSNYLCWTQKLEKYGCYSESMIDEIGMAIKDASYGMNVESGAAYQGALLDVTLKYLCNYGYRLNESFQKTNLYVSMEQLMKVLLLQHISKCEMFMYQTNAYSVKNGRLYTFTELPTKLKMGERSVYLCTKYGIKLSEEEYEAMISVDKSDESGDIFMSPLALLVKTVNKLVNAELRQKYIKSQNDCQ